MLLVDFIGRVVRTGKRGKIPPGVPAILKDLGFGSVEDWLLSYSEWSDRLSNTYRRKVNTPAESLLVRLPLIVATKSQQDALL